MQDCGSESANCFDDWALMDRLEDLELNAIADARANQAEIKVKLNEL